MTNLPPKVQRIARYNIRETAEILGVCRNTVRNAMNDGRLEYHVGRSGRTYISGQAIMSFWADRL